MKTQPVTVMDGPLPTGIWDRTDMEPQFVTAPEHLAVRDEVMRRKPLFYRAEFGTTRQDFERMTAPEFWEVGASGRRFSRQFVLSTLEGRYKIATEDGWAMDEIRRGLMSVPCLTAGSPLQGSGMNGDGETQGVALG